MESYICQVCGIESEKMYCRINEQTLCSKKCAKKYNSWLDNGPCTRCKNKDNPYFCECTLELNTVNDLQETYLEACKMYLDDKELIEFGKLLHDFKTFPLKYHKNKEIRILLYTNLTYLINERWPTDEEQLIENEFKEMAKIYDQLKCYKK